MYNILIIGKGELFSSVVKYLFNNKSKDWITTYPYDQFLFLQSVVKEKDNYQELSNLQNYKRIYLFPENVHEGILLTSFISEWYLGELFIVTQDHGSNFIYKKLGAEYVIISKPNFKTYQWFPEQSKGSLLN
ncbi:hypothetical protein V7157_21145 [Neobacillus drentensis]|uniref:hypothetical protein n=1 Tax=Neobacillus drentensis TaxID=220684 RepID=UPI00300213FF